jgi:hypothetical protein
MVLTVTVPNRPLHEEQSGPGAEIGLAGAGAWRLWVRPASWRWLRPSNWILPKARLHIDLLLASADADRRIEVNLPDGVSPDPSRPLKARAELDIRTEQPLPVTQLAGLVGQMAAAGQDWPPSWTLPPVRAGSHGRVRAWGCLRRLCGRRHRVTGCLHGKSTDGNHDRLRGSSSAGVLLERAAGQGDDRRARRRCRMGHRRLTS